MYKTMYLVLFDAITNIIDILQKALRKAEDIYIESDDTPITLKPNGDN